MMRLALIAPRYGREIAGGAERLTRGFAREAHRRGWIVEVWTTCASDHYDWTNSLSPGQTIDDGIRVIRFPISQFDQERQMALDARLITQGILTGEDQYAWLDAGPHGLALYEHVKLHEAEFDLLIALPYANPLVHFAAWIVPEKTVLWPCLHNEPYAYMEPVRLLLESVLGVVFNSPEEAQIVTDQLQVNLVRSAILGAGVSLPVEKKAALDLKQAVNDDPYLLYVGRLETGKNLGQLYDYVRRCHEEQRLSPRLRLIVVGDGPLVPPNHPAFEYRGFVPDDMMFSIMGSALALCQPSKNESFSLTLMESWLAGRPVLISGSCPVTRGHVCRSKGGLWFESYVEFAGALDWLLTNDELADRMGDNGRRYVQANYTWPAVVDRFTLALSEWQKEAGQMLIPGFE